MKKVFLVAALMASYTYTQAQTKPATTAKPKTTTAPAKPAAAAAPKPATAPLLKSEVDSASYAFGLSIGNDIKSRGVINLNYTVLAQAMNDAMGDKTPVISPEKCQELIMSFLSGVEKKKFEVNINEGTKFLSENGKKPGIVSLPSGLQYEVITAGTGAKPQATDEVTVNYKGTLLNGKQFDSSYDRGEPTSFTLNQVIPGWTEGLQQMTVGSKYRFFIPYALAYGERAAGPDIQPYSTLIFEVELIKIGK